MHGEEFAALLEDSLADRPFWPQRCMDAVRIGTSLRLRMTALRLMHPAVRRRTFWPRYAMRRIAAATITAVGASLLAFALTNSAR
jgi:hypothetical protein